MRKLSVKQIFNDNKLELELDFLLFEDTNQILEYSSVKNSSMGLIGHLNFIHLNWIQIISDQESSFIEKEKITLKKLNSKNTACLIVSNDLKPSQLIIDFCKCNKIPLLQSKQSSLQIIWVLRSYLSRFIADKKQLHGVLLDVLGMGVLIIGKSGVGKSELALELISRGSGLVADDIVEIFHIGPHTLECVCSEMLLDYLEVRGIGMLNIKTIFGETAVRRKKNLKLIIELKKFDTSSKLQRLPLNSSHENILGVEVRKITLPVAAGRNLAVLVEAAVRNYILQLRGIDCTKEFIERQSNFIKKNEN